MWFFPKLQPYQHLFGSAGAAVTWFPGAQDDMRLSAGTAPGTVKCADHFTINSLQGGYINGKDDISAQEKTARKSAWLQIQNEHQGRQKGSVRPQAQRQKADRSLTGGSGNRTGWKAEESCWVQHDSLCTEWNIIKKLTFQNNSVPFYRSKKSVNHRFRMSVPAETLKGPVLLNYGISEEELGF